MKMDKTTLLILAVVVAIVVVAIILLIFTRSSIPSAIKQYENEFQQCAEMYAKAFNTFLTNSPKGFNQSELDTLKTLQECMNSAANGIAKLTKSLNQNPIDILAQYLGRAIEIVAASIGVAVVLPRLITYVKKAVTNGGTAASVLQNAIVQVDVSNGIITANQAAGVRFILQQQLYPLNQTMVQDFLNALVVEGIITSSVAADLYALYTSYMASDLAETLALLPPPPVA